MIGNTRRRQNSMLESRPCTTSQHRRLSGSHVFQGDITAAILSSQQTCSWRAWLPCSHVYRDLRTSQPLRILPAGVATASETLKGHGKRHLSCQSTGQDPKLIRRQHLRRPCEFLRRGWRLTTMYTTTCRSTSTLLTLRGASMAPRHACALMMLAGV